MNLATANETILTPALSLLPTKMDSKLARVMLLAIGLQESRFQYRRQILNGGGKGAAASFWQMERGGGVRGVLTHAASKDLARQVCAARGVAPTEIAIWQAIEHDDILGACFARLLLWTDPKSIPDNADDAWSLYLRVWRPGKPKPDTWHDFYRQAQKTIYG